MDELSLSREVVDGVGSAMLQHTLEGELIGILPWLPSVEVTKKPKAF